MQCTGPSCNAAKQRIFAQIFCGLEIPTPHDQNIAHRCFYTEGWLIYRDAFIHGCLYTEMFFTKTCFYTQTFAHKDAFIRRCFYAQLPLRTGAVTQGWFYTKELLHTDTRVLIHTDAFT